MPGSNYTVNVKSRQVRQLTQESKTKERAFDSSSPHLVFALPAPVLGLRGRRRVQRAFPDPATAHGHLQSPAETATGLQPDPANGLSAAEAATRLQRFGPNELIERGGKMPWQILLGQFTSKLVLILIVAAVVSAIVGDFKDAVAIIAIAILNAVLGFVQEHRAEQAMAALRKLTVPNVRVRREGQARISPPVTWFPVTWCALRPAT